MRFSSLLALAALLLTGCAPGADVATQARAAGLDAAAAQAQLNAVPNRDGTIVLDSEELTKLFNSAVRPQVTAQTRGVVQIRNARGRLEGSRANLVFDIARPVDTTINVTGGIVEREGKLEVDLQQGSLGGFPLPGFLLDRLDTQLNRELARIELPAPVREVAIRGGLLIIRLRPS